MAFVKTGIPWIIQPNIITANKRLYSVEVIDAGLAEVDEKVKSRKLFGHPLKPGGTDSISDVSHLVTRMYRKGDQIFVDVEIMETEMGRELMRLLEEQPQVALVAYPVSYGSVNRDDEGHEVVEGMQISHIELTISGEKDLYAILKNRMKIRDSRIDVGLVDSPVIVPMFQCPKCGSSDYAIMTGECRQCGHKSKMEIEHGLTDAQVGLVQAIQAIECGQWEEDGLAISLRVGIGFLVDLKTKLGGRITLVNEDDEAKGFQCSVRTWGEILRCARNGGWKPEGTLPPLDDAGNVCAGYTKENYISTDGQLVSDTDVQFMDHALKSMAPHVQPTEFKKIVYEFLKFLANGPFRIK